MLLPEEIIPNPPGAVLARDEEDAAVNGHFGLCWVAEKPIHLQRAGTEAPGTILSFQQRLRVFVARQGLSADEINEIGTLAAAARMDTIILRETQGILVIIGEMRWSIRRLQGSSVNVDGMITETGALIDRLQTTVQEKENAIDAAFEKLRSLGVDRLLDRDQEDLLGPLYGPGPDYMPHMVSRTQN